MKQPSFQFYPNDWARDLEEFPLEIEGAWIRICCKLWWATPRGRLTKPLEEWARILRISQRKACEILQITLKKNICDGTYLDNQNITIISRRMEKDEKIRKIRQEVGKLGGNPGLMKIRENLVNQDLNQNATKSASLLLQSSSSIKEKNKDIARSVKTKRAITLPDNDFIQALKENIAYEGINIDREIGKIDAWLLTPRGKGKQKTRQRIVNWLNRAEKPMASFNNPPTDPMDRRMWDIERLREKENAKKNNL